MGNRNSKEVPSPIPPQMMAGGTMNILVTKEVTDRWQALMHQQVNKGKQFEIGAGGDHGDVKQDNLKNPDLEIDKLSKLEENSVEKGEERLFQKPSSQPSETEKVKEIVTASRNSVGNTADNVDTDRVGASSAGSGSGSDMDKLLSHFKVHNEAMKQEKDVENGTSDDYIVDPDPVLLPEHKRFGFVPSETFQDFQEYEEINETKNKKVPPPPPPSFFDEEAAFGGKANEIPDFGKSSSAKGKVEVQEFRIPKSALPIIIDQDENGKPVFQTVASWKVRDQANQQIERNNQYWSDQLERITTQMEDETRKEAIDFQRRLQRINDRHPEIYSTSHLPGSHCNMLSSQITKCYEQNPGQVLRCNELVRQFANCANNVMLGQYGNQNQVPPSKY